jgi:hypothetical protein
MERMEIWKMLFIYIAVAVLIYVYLCYKRYYNKNTLYRKYFNGIIWYLQYRHWLFGWRYIPLNPKVMSSTRTGYPVRCYYFASSVSMNKEHYTMNSFVKQYPQIRDYFKVLRMESNNLNKIAVEQENISKQPEEYIYLN